MSLTTRLRAVAKVAVAAALSLTLVAGCSLEDDGDAGGTTQDGKDVLRVGYLHTVAVDSHLWYGIEKGIFAKHDLEIEATKFDTGIAESQALSGGSIDLAGMGAVLSNFPAQGGGKVIGVNDVEFDTAQLWVAPDAGIDSVADLKGKEVLTTVGTTAHVFLHNALKANGVDPSSVTVTNADMPSVTSAFVAGQADAVVVWVPFDQTIKKEFPEAKLVDSAKNYYPESAILGGWAANNGYYAEHPDVLQRFLEAWLEINDALVNDTDAALEVVHEAAYAETQELAETKRQFSFAKLHTNAEWAEQFANGDVENWIGQVEQTFVEVGGIDEFIEPSEFVDTDLFAKAYANWEKQK